MTERPILFKATMVRAILDGRKTQTRRVIRIQPPDARSFGVVHSHTIKNYSIVFLDREDNCEDTTAVSNIIKCPFGEVGDRLWVRETWQIRDKRRPSEVTYFADDPMTCAPWRPSIHMPRAASRITLEITGVHVERLQDISEADAKAEGIERFMQGGVEVFKDYLERHHALYHSVFAFKSLWESINGFDSWETNPWVWVIEFKRVMA